MDDFRTVIKVENNTSASYNLHRMFSIVGETPEVYPLDPSAETPAQHSFLKFSSTIFANNALNLKWEIPGLQVLPIHEQPCLIEQYRRANPAMALTGEDDLPTNTLSSQQEEQRICHEIPSVTELDRDFKFPVARSRKNHRSNTISKRCSTSMMGAGEYYVQEQEAHGFNAIPQPFDFSGYAMQNWDVGPQAMISLKALEGWDMDRLDEHPSSELFVCGASTSVTASAGPLTSLRIASAESKPVVATFSMSCESRISMELCGETILYDLKDLESNPRVIIELLKVTKSERGNYMLVGAFYRRTGNPQAAKTVINAMIEEFTLQGVGASDFKPAYLLLSGCETDLAKIAKTEGKDTQTVSGHCKAAKSWLQKVFGIADPSRTEAETKENLDHSNPLYAKELNGTSDKSADYKDIQELERKIQSLRDRNFNQGRQIAQLQSQKRKLEDDYLHERDLRRKYQRKLDEAERDRDTARKMEKHALNQVTREVAARRQAEEKLGK